jgi:predicted membrane chloride channel (bestrophin family)
MARTFLFFFVFTMPFVLCHDNFPYPFEPLTMIFLITFGFVGVEIVCMELNDPFGDGACNIWTFCSMLWRLDRKAHRIYRLLCCRV